MSTLTLIYDPELKPLNVIEKYEVIENELIEDRDFNELSIPGVLMTFTIFKNVTFENCVFFGSRLENCEFVNCKFIDTKFQFCNLSYCNFKFSTFEYCNWDVSPTKDCTFISCLLDSKSLYYLGKNSNYLETCFSNAFEKNLNEAA